ncbi:retention module-containing protein, partial [Shewanella gelidii]
MGVAITSEQSTVTQLKGQLQAKDNLGNTRPIQEGDEIQSGEQLFFSNDTQFVLRLLDGRLITHDDLLSAPEVSPLSENLGVGDFDDEIAQLQAQILAGDDPTEDLPETAAGDGQLTNQGGTGFVNVNRGGAETLATAGHSTQGFNSTASSFIQNNDIEAVQIFDADEVLFTDEDTLLLGNVLDNFVGIPNSVLVVSYKLTGDPQTYQAGDTVEITNVGRLTINSDGTFIFAPDDNYNGPVPIATYTLSDGSVSDTSTLTIDVTPITDNFDDEDEQVSAPEDTVLEGSVLNGTSSVEGDVTVISFTVAGDNSTYNAGDSVTIAGIGVLILNTDGSYSFTPALNYNGPVPVVTYLLTDGLSNDTSTLTISVTPETDPFVDANEVVSTAE